MSAIISVSPKVRPALDPEFVPASLWNRAYRALAQIGGGGPLAIALERSDGSRLRLPHRHPAARRRNVAVNQRYIERLLKFLLWQKGGCRVTVAGDPRIAAYLRTRLFARRRRAPSITSSWASASTAGP